MSDYVYNDEDNNPMHGVQPRWRISPEGKIQFIEKVEPEVDTTKRGCWCCFNYDGDHCTKNWNNLDPSYYVPCLDDKKPDEICDDFNFDEEAWRCGL